VPPLEQAPARSRIPPSPRRTRCVHMSVSSRPGAANAQVDAGFWRTGSRSDQMCPAVVPRRFENGSHGLHRGGCSQLWSC
jgi:hypothetical protein